MKFNSIPSRLFTYNPLTHTFVADASDLNGHDFLQRKNDDPRSRGFSMKSTKTGVEVPFFLVRTAKTRDNEVSFWEFSCGHDDNPNGEHYLTKIFND